MIEWVVKKVILSKVNSLLKTYAKNVDKARETLKLWTSRLQKILKCFESMLKKLDDGELSEQELKEASDEVMKLIKEF
jgi:ribosome-binding protein aMBF1 (putative translation factor)